MKLNEMKQYSWKGIDREGRQRKGVTFSPSVAILKDELLVRGVAVLSASESKGKSIGKSLLTRSKVSDIDIVNFFRFLSLLLSCGMNLVEALSVLGRKLTSSGMRDVVEALSADIVKGVMLSRAAAKHHKVFTHSDIAAIEAGEKAGFLDSILEEIADYRYDQLKFKQKLKHLSLMPVFTLLIAGLLVGFIFAFVVPRFEAFLSSSSQSLPPYTRLIFDLSKVLRASSTFIFTGSFLFAYLLLQRLRVVNRLFSSIKLRAIKLLKPTRNIYRLNHLIRFLNTVSMLLRSGVPLVEALSKSSGIVEDKAFKKEIFVLIDRISSGKSLEQAVTSNNFEFFPTELAAFIAVGEKTANLDVAIKKASTLFAVELESNLNVAVAAFQPVLIVFIGIIIGGLMLSLYLPIINLARAF